MLKGRGTTTFWVVLTRELKVLASHTENIVGGHKMFPPFKKSRGGGGLENN